jgi:hypothetical protein
VDFYSALNKICKRAYNFLDKFVRRGPCYLAMVDRRPVFIFLLAFLLVFAQGRAALHELSHLSEPHSTPEQPSKHVPHSHVCKQCLVFAQLGGAMPSMPLFVEPQQIVTAHALPAARHIITSSLSYPYYSRGPPSLV